MPTNPPKNMTHAGMGLYARLLVMVVAAFGGTQVLRGRRLPGFSWRTRS